MKQFALLPRPAAALLVLGLASCGSDLTLPSSSAAGLNLAVLEGDGQVGTVGEPLPAPVVVVVRTDAGAPMADRQVAFAPSGSAGVFDPATAVTNSEGQALTHWVLGTAPGPYIGEARVVAEGDSVVPVVSLQAAAVAGTPDTVRAAGPTTQPGRRGEPLASPLVVVVVDRYSNPVEGADVVWQVTSGNGELSASQTLTGADGSTSVTWTLGNRIGVQKATAIVDGASGSPLSFTATVLF